MPKDPVNGDFEDTLRDALPLSPELRAKIYRYSQDAWIQEVASLIGDLYQMFVKMRYLKAEQVEYPPYAGSNALDMDLITELGLSDDVISLLQQLPYVADAGDWKHGNEDSVFFHSGGVFLDYRNRDELERSRDPLWCEPWGGAKIGVRRADRT